MAQSPKPSTTPSAAETDDRPPPTGLPAFLANRPYVLLTLTSLFWAGNIVLGRYVAGHVPPVALSFFRWLGAFLLLAPFAWPHLRTDWVAIRRHFPLLLLLSFTGIGVYNTMAYFGLQFTEALNASLLQSAGPLFVAFWSLVLFGVRLTSSQILGIAISLMGVFTIILRGDIETLTHIRLNKGDVYFTTALFIFAFYSALAVKRPPMHSLSFLALITGLGALEILPFWLWESATGYVAQADIKTALAVLYVATMPSVAAYLCFNRGIELIGPNRAAPFFHLMPVFASGLAILLLGETLHPYHAIGYVLVVAGIVIAARK